MHFFWYDTTPAGMKDDRETLLQVRVVDFDEFVDAEILHLLHIGFPFFLDIRLSCEQ